MEFSSVAFSLCIFLFTCTCTHALKPADATHRPATNSMNNTTVTDRVHVQAANYDYWCVGNCNQRVTTNPHAGIILMGGGTDVEDAFKQQIAWSDCGDFLVLRASGTDAYNSYILGLGCANSVSTLLLKNKAGANDDFVISTIDDAEAIFFAGGNQWTYVNEWMGSQLQTAVQSAMDDRSVPIGGTSAGCMVETGRIFDSEYGSVYSDEALANPYNHYMTFASSMFVTAKYSLLNHTISDTHFQQRDRFGRLLAFVARMNTDNAIHNGVYYKGIALNEQTAIAIDLATNIGTTMRQSHSGDYGMAFILTPSAPPDVCRANTPLTYANVDTQKLEASRGDTYDFGKWSGGAASNQYKVTANTGKIDGNPYSP